MHCVANGHEVVAVANLYSKVNENKEEIDSFMYQTVGSNDVVPVIAECLGLPLFRRCITGSSVSVGMEYTVEKEDEVEDLLRLLEDVKVRIVDPRLCSRLGLTPLAYLWQSNQSELLQSMLDNGLTAVLAKVACMGLDTPHLGKTLNEMQPLLEKLGNQFGCHICGEGGEYETLTIDCPLFKKRIQLIETETVIHSNDAFAIVAYFKVNKFALIEKPVEEVGLTEEMKQRLLEFGTEKYTTDAMELKTLVKKYRSETSCGPRSLIPVIKSNEAVGMAPSVGYSNGFLAVSGVRARTCGSVIEETTDCMDQISETLNARGMKWSQVVMMQLFVADMGEFGSLNEVYGSYLGVNPPTRVTVEVGFPAGEECRIQIDCLAFNDSEADGGIKVNNSCMHVQGISYWAELNTYNRPSNIGPYSQTFKLNDHLFVAGQIGLIPNAMILPAISSDPTDLTQLLAECLLCFHNLENVAEVQGCEFPGSDVANLLCFVRRAEYLDFVKRFCADRIQKFDKIPCLFIAVPRLPRSCAVEFQVMFQSPKDVPAVEDTFSDDEEDSQTAVTRRLPVIAEFFQENETVAFQGEEARVNVQVKSWARGSLLSMAGYAQVSEPQLFAAHHLSQAIETIYSLIQALQRKHANATPAVLIKLFHVKQIPGAVLLEVANRVFGDGNGKTSISCVSVDAVSEVEGGVVGVHATFPLLQ
ncbi:ATP binding domain 4 [Podochytrium sp. JEL0797]|nr:ATP binding domain 4 [Podochytrium sp. JEL0797]